MRRVDGEVDSLGGRGRKRAAKSNLRRLALESLEDRTLMLTLPSPVTQGQFAVGGSQSGQGNSSTPSVAVDPLNPNKLVAAWTVNDPGHLFDGSGGQVTSYVQGAYSTNGGQTWSALPNSTAADIQNNFSIAPPTSGPQPHFAQTTDATVAFDRNENAYLLTSTHDAGSANGVLDLQRWTFTGNGAPVAQTFTRPAYQQINNSNTLNAIYRWQGADGALTPTLAVDSNAALFTNGSTTQTDQLSGNVYVAWETQDTAPKNVSQNANTIKLMASSDLGQDFTYQAYLNNHNTGHLYDQPRIAISQGSATVPGGQVTIVYDDAGVSTAAPFFDEIQTKISDTGGTDEHFDSSGTPTPIANAVKDGVASGVDAIATTTIPIPVNITDSNFQALQNLTLTLSLQYPTLANTSAILTAPDGTMVVLWNNATNNAGTATNAPGVLSGANVGASTQGPYIGTVLDSTANRSLFDGNVGAPYTGHFQPFGNLNAFKNEAAIALNGTWTLTITDFRNETATTPRQLLGASLDFTSGNSDITTNPASTVATTYLNSGAHQYTGSGIQNGATLAAPSIASDNTLGSRANSPYLGRLYIAFTDDLYTTGKAYTNSTFIRLYYSDDGGQSWIPDAVDAITGVQDGIVNDDNGLADGFSTGGFAQAGSGTSGDGLIPPDGTVPIGESNVRPKMEPQVAVNQDTGTLVISYFDTRNDAAEVRVATYIAASTDGGASFAPQVYANASTIVKDAITGASVNLGPVPDNESAGNGGRDTTFGFGTRQGLAVANGHIIPVWSSNQNAGSAGRSVTSYLTIRSAILDVAAGPRVISSTQGPVGQPGDTINTARAADGTPIANTIVITFDRAINPATFLGGVNSPIQVFYNNPSGTPAPVQLPVTNVVANDSTNTSFTVTFDPQGHGVGSYTYNLLPTIQGVVPYQILVGGALTTVPGNFLDQNGNGTPGQNPGDIYSVPNGRGMLPLVVPGPHVVSTGVTGVNGTGSTGSDNLVNNDNVNSINVTFDRQMQVSSFTPAQVLSIVGPTGQINTPQVFTSTGTSKTYSTVGTYQLIPMGSTLASAIQIANTGLRVASVNVQVNITDPNDQNLTLVLMAPDGTMVPLVNAGDATGANLTNTSFSDAPPASGQTSTIPGGAAPYSLTYQPASPLSALSTHLLDGNWVLMVADSAADGTANYRLNSWSLTVTPRIPKGANTELDSTLVISSFPDNSFKIGHLAVQLNITSTMDSGLQVALVSPTGIVIPLINAGTTSGVNFTNTTFDDNGTIPIASGAAPYNLTYKPASPLSALNGLSIEGTWTLQIKHSTMDATASTLNSWSLIATPQITVTPVNPVNGGAKTFTIGFPTQYLSGTYTATLSSNILSVAANPASPSQGTPLDTNLNAGVATVLGISSGPTTTVNAAATSVPVAIPYATSSMGTNTPGVLTSQINVTDNFAVQGDLPVNGVPDSLAGLTVSLNISYYNDPDLAVTLTAPGPNGRSVTLFMNVGSGGNTADFKNTTFSDTIVPLAPITAAGAPYFGTFNPQMPLAAFATDGQGNQAFSQGLWTLTITNIGLDPGPAKDSQNPPSLLNWSLKFQKPQVNTGLGEPVADQTTVGFRLFNFAATNPLSNDTWTAVGPAGTSAAFNPNLDNTPYAVASDGSSIGANYAGPVSVVAVNPADPSGNTAYIGSSSGGIWKTTNFLTTNSSGPTYLPLTDFGTNYSINIGGIAIFDQNNDPTQSIIFAGTGNGQATTATVTNGNSAQGVGILRSTNGGGSFTLLDSTNNVYPAQYPAVYPNGTPVPAGLVGTALPSALVGTPLPINSPFRDHVFVGTTTYKVIVDPTPQTGGGVIVYAALGGPHGGLWRSTDGGNNWANLSALSGLGNAAATDVLLDPASADTTTHNLDILYAGFMGLGVYMSSAQGQALTEVLGNVGADNLIQNGAVVPGTPLTVNDANPNGPNVGRILLAKPALTGNKAVDISYQDWLYAAVENADGSFNGLYVTKDRGENWTKAQIASQPTPPAGNTVTQALPTNDNTQALNYDVTNSTKGSATGGDQFQDGNAAFSMTIDPLNPNIVYLGGTQIHSTSGLIRVNLTGLYDAHAFVPYASNLNDGGTLAQDSTGRINSLKNVDPIFLGTNPQVLGSRTYYLNLRHSPNSTFDVNSTLFILNSSSFTNSGYGVTWEPIDQVYGSPLEGSTNIHQILSVVDPLTGLTRLIFADDQGVFTGVYNADGSLSTAGIGTEPTVTGSRNGNLQDEQLYASAAQPSALAAQAAGALFYASGIGTTNLQSASNLLSTGNLTWKNTGTSYGDLQDSIQTNDRGGTGIATDQTGGVSPANPNGQPSFYQYDIPQLGGDSTNFFRVGDNGSTTGLTNNFQTAWPFNNVLSQGNGVTQLGNFTVNPINGSQILIGSNLGTLFETTNQGIQWLPIGTAADFDGTYTAALTYGAPDPSAPNGIGNLDNFIYVGTVGGHIYLTRTGGGPWTNLSAGLDGSSIVSIYTDPTRGSHDAYAVTLKGAYYLADSTVAGATWVNITGNLTQIQGNAFSDPTLAQNSLLGYNGTQLGGFRSIIADYRYAIPNPANPLLTYPILYVAGYGGVFRSLDNGQTWTAFPNTAFDTSPVDGGYLPHTDVTGLQLNLGAINPATGRATQVSGDPEVLLASTLGRGDFAIRLAPAVLSNSISLDPAHPAPGGSASGTVNGNPLLTNVTTPFIEGTSEISNFGNLVTITLIDQTPGTGFGQIIGTGFTDAFGHFSVQVSSQVGTHDPSFLNSGVKNVGIQATDSAGAKGNLTVFTYTLDSDKPTVPAPLLLTPASDSGLSNNDLLTNVTTPVFTVPSTEPITTIVQLYRAYTDANNVTQYELVNSEPAGTGTGIVTLTDKRLLADITAGGGGLIDSMLTYYAIQVNQAGNYSTPLANLAGDPATLTITVDNVPPPQPAQPMLAPVSNTGLDPSQNITNSPNPAFNLSGLLPNETVVLIRTFQGGAPTVVNVLLPVNGVTATSIADTTGVTADGTYLYQIQVFDLAFNASVFSPSLPVTVNTQLPAAPTLMLLAADDSGRNSVPIQLNVTNVNTPHFTGTAPFNATTGNFPVQIVEGETSSTTKPVPLSSNGVVSSQLALAVPAGQHVAAGYVTLTLSNTSQPGGLNLGNLAVALVGPGGQSFFLLQPSTTLTSMSQSSQNYLIPSSFLTAGALSGTYTLVIANFTPGDVGKLTSWSVTLLNGPGNTPTVLASTTAVSSGTYATQITNPLPDGVHTLVAVVRSPAGTPNYSVPLPLTIKATPPQLVPTLVLQPTSDTGVKGDGVTANRRPVFTGTADKGAVIKLFATLNGQVIDTGASTTASTVNGSFTIQLPFNLTNGVTVLAVRSIDAANNVGPASVPLALQIITVTGDYLNTGAAQPTIFDPNTETYYVLGGGAVSVASTPYSVVPVQYDFNGDGSTDNVGYNYSAASYMGLVSPGSLINQPYGTAGASLPISGTYGPGGVFALANFVPSGANWAINYPNTYSGPFVVPNLDVPVPAAYDGFGVSEIAVFRPSPVAGALGTAASDADSFSVAGPAGYYQVSFTSPAVTKLGFVYKAGDIPAPADYDGVGRDEFAVYRPSTGQFFILKTPSDTNTATWTLRTVSLNLPGGPNVNDVPVTEDYDGNGKADPSVYRPSNSTFYILHTSTGIQQTLPFGLGNFDLAPAGPLLYRLSALTAPGTAPTTDGYAPGVAGLRGVASPGATTRSIVSAQSFSSEPVPAVVAVAAPTAVVTPPAPAPATVSVTPSAASAPSAGIAVTIGAATPTLFIPTVNTTKPAPIVKAKTLAKPKHQTIKVEAMAKAKPQAPAAHAKVKVATAKPHGAAVKHVASARKG